MKYLRRFALEFSSAFGPKQHTLFGGDAYLPCLDRLNRLLSEAERRIKEQNRLALYERVCGFYDGRQDRVNQLTLLLESSTSDKAVNSLWIKERAPPEDYAERLRENRLCYGLETPFLVILGKRVLNNYLGLSEAKIKQIFGHEKRDAIALLDYIFLEALPREFMVLRYPTDGSFYPSEFLEKGFSFSPYPQGSPQFISKGEVFRSIERHLTKDNARFLLHHLSQTFKRPVAREEIKGIPIIDGAKEGQYSVVWCIETSLTTEDKPVKFVIQTPLNLGESQNTLTQDFENLTADFKKNPWFVPKTYGLYEESVEGRSEGTTIRFFAEEWLNVRELHIQEDENGRRFIIWHSTRQLDSKENHNYVPVQPAEASDTHRHEVIRPIFPSYVETHVHLGEQDNAKVVEETVRIKTVYYNLEKELAIGKFQINNGDLAYEELEEGGHVYLITHRANLPMSLYDFFLNELVFLKAADTRGSIFEVPPMTMHINIIPLGTEHPYNILRGFYGGLVENLYSTGKSLDEASEEAKKLVYEALRKLEADSNKEVLAHLLKNNDFLTNQQEVTDLLQRFKATIPRFMEDMRHPDMTASIKETILNRASKSKSKDVVNWLTR